MSRDENSLSHTVWNCKYHIVFAPKYRRQVFFNETKGTLLARQLVDTYGNALNCGLINVN